MKPAWRKSRRFFYLCWQFRFRKRNTDFSYIGKVNFNRDMLLTANLLRAVDHNLFNQFIFCSGSKFLQVGIPVSKLKKTPYIGYLPSFIFNFTFQRNGKSLSSVSYRAESF